MKLHLHYFAILAQEAKVSQETLDFEGDLRSLYGQCRERHGFGLEWSQVRPALNDDFVGWDQALAEGDRVTFIPPVSGG